MGFSTSRKHSAYFEFGTELSDWLDLIPWVSRVSKPPGTVCSLPETAGLNAIDCGLEKFG